MPRRRGQLGKIRFVICYAAAAVIFSYAALRHSAEAAPAAAKHPENTAHSPHTAAAAAVFLLIGVNRSGRLHRRRVWQTLSGDGRGLQNGKIILPRVASAAELAFDASAFFCK